MRTGSFRAGECCALCARWRRFVSGLAGVQSPPTRVGRLQKNRVVGVLGDRGCAAAAVPRPESIFLPLRDGAGGGDSLRGNRRGTAVCTASSVAGAPANLHLKYLHMDVVGGRTDGNGDRGGLADTVADVPHLHLAVRIRVGDITIRRLPGLMIVVRYRQCGSEQGRKKYRPRSACSLPWVRPDRPETTKSGRIGAYRRLRSHGSALGAPDYGKLTVVMSPVVTVTAGLDVASGSRAGAGGDAVSSWAFSEWLPAQRPVVAIVDPPL